jgi:hypothetical protein
MLLPPRGLRDVPWMPQSGIDVLPVATPRGLYHYMEIWPKEHIPQRSTSRSTWLCGCAARIVLAGWTLLATAGPLVAETNQWMKSASGKWEESEWSLGILPESSQSIEIANAAEMTIEIDLATVQAAPTSMMIQHLLVSGRNTLLLNDAGTSTPFRVLSDINVPRNGVVLSNRGTLVNLGSSLIVGDSAAGLLRIVSGGRLRQDGGLVKTTAAYIYGEGNYHLTNGTFECDRLDFPTFGGSFDQYGGRASVGSLHIIYSSYNLHDGDLIVRDAIAVSDSARFIQQGGTNRAADVRVASSDAGGGMYVLSGGFLGTSNVFVGAYRSSSEFEQTGGVHIVTNRLSLQGSARYHPPVAIPGRYDLANGILSAGNLELDGRYGFAEFVQESGSTSISESLQLNLGESHYRGDIVLGGGTLACSNVDYAGAGVDILQMGGALIVTNLFSFGGHIPPPFWVPAERRYPRYDFKAGRLIAANIELCAEWIIGSTPGEGRITNRGFFKMAGTLRIGNANEHLGRFILASNAVIDFGAGSAKLGFMKSSAEDWNPEALLVVTNWSGSFTGNGEDQLKFGNDPSGLTAQQLGRVRFANPAGLSPGDYLSMMLPTGELVPLQQPSLSVEWITNKMILRWNYNAVVQTATNVAGPYADFSAGKSPYTIEITAERHRFFRVQQQFDRELEMRSNAKELRQAE